MQAMRHHTQYRKLERVQQAVADLILQEEHAKEINPEKVKDLQKTWSTIGNEARFLRALRI